MIRAGVVLGTETCRWGFLAGHPECSWPPCRGPGWVLGIARQALVRIFLKFCIYIPRFGNKISVYFSLILIPFFFFF